MTPEAWTFLAAAVIEGVLLAIAIAGDAHLAAENRRLRAQRSGLLEMNVDKGAALRSRANHPAGRGLARISADGLAEIATGADVIALREALEARDAGTEPGA